MVPDAPAPRRGLGRRLGALALKLALSCVLLAVLLEVGVTLALGPQVRFPRHVVDGGFGLRVNEPGARYTHRSPDVTIPFRINARGLRADRDYPYAKPAGAKRIVCIGDSFTAGYEVTIEDCFTSVLERELVERGHRVEVLNAGVSGYSNAEACLYLERELLKYEPDVVVLSFFFNDLVDNVRSGLFALQGDELVQVGQGYVPLGGLGDRLNRSAVMGFLSERSNAFSLLKEKATHVVKRSMVAENQANVTSRDGTGGSGGAAAPGAIEDDAEERLAAAILQRILDTTRALDIPFVVQSIPLYVAAPEGEILVDAFPYEHFPTDQPGLTFLATEPLLQPHLGIEQLYWLQSHFHWTPFAHRISGEALARLVDERKLLD